MTQNLIRAFYEIDVKGDPKNVIFNE